MHTNWKLGLGFSLITALMWGLLPLSLQVVLEVMDPLTISWYRFAVSAVIALVWYGFSSGAALKGLLSARHRGPAIAAAVGLTGNYLLYIWGLSYTTPGAAQLLIQLAPLLLLTGSVFLFREPFSRWQWLGVAAVTIGMLLFFHPRIAGATQNSPGYATGILLLVAASASWAVYGLAQKKLLLGFHTKHILLYLCIAGTLILLPMAQPLQVMQLDSVELAMLSFASLNTIVAYGCFGLAMSYWQSSRVSAIIPLAPLLTLLFTALFNHWQIMDVRAEPMNGISGVGALLVVGGAVLAALPRQRQ